MTPPVNGTGSWNQLAIVKAWTDLRVKTCAAAISLRRRRPVEVRSWRCAHGVKPPADVDLGVRFTAVMPRPSCIGCLRTPPMHGQIGISTSNHEPVDRRTRHGSTDLTSEFLQRCHRLFPEACLAFISQLRRELNLVSTPSTRRPVPSSPCHEAGKHAPSSIVRE